MSETWRHRIFTTTCIAVLVAMLAGMAYLAWWDATHAIYPTLCEDGLIRFDVKERP